MTEQEALASDEIIESKSPILNTSARILFDFESTHSFMSHKFVLHLKNAPTSLDYSLTVSTPMGDSLDVTTYLRACIINILVMSSLLILYC